MTEFNLSETEWFDGTMYLYNKEDVKEFIRLLKEKLSYHCPGCNTDRCNGIDLEEIDKLAGEKLT